MKQPGNMCLAEFRSDSVLETSWKGAKGRELFAQRERVVAALLVVNVDGLGAS